MALMCERCGIEIRSGEPVASWTNGIGFIVVHRFPWQCDERGVEMVAELNRKFEEQKKKDESNQRQK